jgi:hypothetical protein
MPVLNARREVAVNDRRDIVRALKISIVFLEIRMNSVKRSVREASRDGTALHQLLVCNIDFCEASDDRGCSLLETISEVILGPFFESVI